jgi:glycosyltransferase involved in cell wall biosynthesis
MIQNYSVILPFFNAEKTLSSAINSALQQTWFPSEIVLVNDGSSDSSLQIAESYLQRYTNIKLRNLPKNTGVSNARNVGIQLSTESILVFFDSDDISHPRRCEEHLDFLSKNSDISYVSSNKYYPSGFRVHNVNSNYLGALNECRFVRRLFLGPDHEMSPNLNIPASTMAMKKTLLEKIGLFDDSLKRIEDVDLAIRACAVGAIFGFSEKILVDRFYTYNPIKSDRIELNSYCRLYELHQEKLDATSKEIVTVFLQFKIALMDKDFIAIFRNLPFVLKYYASNSRKFREFFRKKCRNFRKRVR